MFSNATATVRNLLLSSIENALLPHERLTVRANGACVVAVIFDVEPAGGGLRGIIAGAEAPTVEAAVIGAFASAGRPLSC